MPERLRNLFLNGSGDAIAYTSPKAMGAQLRVPARDRVEHSLRLQQQLDQAWSTAASSKSSRQALSLPAREGIYVEFRGALGYDLATSSLEDRRAGIRLLNVRTQEGTDGKELTLATVFVPAGKESCFLRKITDYAEKVTPKGKPRNADLVESIDDIRLAVLESFWQDKPDRMPEGAPVWCEVWIRGADDASETAFREVAKSLSVELQEGCLRFPERAVVLARANRSQLTELIESCPLIAELRRALETAQFFISLDNEEQGQWVKDLMERVSVDEKSRVAVCILDSGMNNGHPLLQPLAADEDCQSYDSAWGSNDHLGHGTLMGGLAGYGDLESLLQSQDTVKVLHKLESVKILPPHGQNDPRLFGYITIQGVSRAEIQQPDRTHINCMAVTADACRRGRPSSWSAAIDELTSGYFDGRKRLFLVSAGNVDQDEWNAYPESNTTHPIEDPGQSWNAITVGACTTKATLTEADLDGFQPVAPAGGLSPHSSTSLIWEGKKWPVKPDIVLEGGNAARDDGGFCTTCNDLSIVSTHHKHTVRQFEPFSGTSAATAQAAWMASQIQVAYPEAWPETVRALLVHSADWTPPMRQQFLGGESKSDYRRLLRICGYGIPRLERALWCAANSVNLVIQDEMRPYEKKDGRCRTRDMHLHELPWPREVFLSMGEVPVEMRVTLSYFVEPSPGEIGWKDRYRYPSCVLRFDAKNTTESKEAFVKRINAAATDDTVEDSTSGPSISQRWRIGTQGRDLGSIHSDTWEGTAAELAECNIIGVYPRTGWWKERDYLGRWNRKIRYSLVVSLSTPEESIDLYTPIANQISVPVVVGL